MMRWTDPAQQYAVWDGRFQPLHLGHFGVILAILREFDLPLVVMIIQSTVAASAGGYTATVNRHHLEQRNPLTLWERHRMLSAVLKAENLDRQVTVLGIPRPDLYWPIAKSFYPPRRFVCLTTKDDYERAKQEFWRSLSEEFRLVDTSEVPLVSATALKEAIRNGDEWQTMMHPSTVDYFQEIRGPERFRDADF